MSKLAFLSLPAVSSVAGRESPSRDLHWSWAHCMIAGSGVAPLEQSVSDETEGDDCVQARLAAGRVTDAVRL